MTSKAWWISQGDNLTHVYSQDTPKVQDGNLLIKPYSFASGEWDFCLNDADIRKVMDESGRHPQDKDGKSISPARWKLIRKLAIFPEEDK